MFSNLSISLRPVEATDLDFLRELRSHQSTWEQLGDIEMLTKRSQEEWFANLGNRQRYFVIQPNLYMEEGLPRYGMVRCDQIDWINRSVRVGADIAPEFRGKGLGRATYDCLLKYCFDYLNLHRVWLAVLETNKPALNLYKSLGFQDEGCYRQAVFRDGAYCDYLVMSLLKPEYKAKESRQV